AIRSASRSGSSDRWRSGPISTSACSSARRLAGDSPSGPSSPSPTMVSHGASAMRPNLLILAGTTEATALACALSKRGLAATLSFAGRVARPLPQPLPQRIGGFGGPEGLAAWLQAHRITHVIDATHPFAVQMSRNAVAACARADVPLLALTRPEWQSVPGDWWQHVTDIPGAVAALDRPRATVMLAGGRMHLADFAPNPQ